MINVHVGISADMAVQLSIALNISSDMWINMQGMYDLWQAEKKRKKLKVKPIFGKLAVALQFRKAYERSLLAKLRNNFS